MNVTVERKLPAHADYISLFTQQGSGSFMAGNGSYTDDISALPAGITIKYRLKMNIAADTSFYLDSAVVNYAASCDLITEKIIISPNPVTDKLTVLVVKNDPVKVTVVIQALSGQTLYKKTHQLTGSISFIIPMEHMSKGIYFVSVYFEDKKQLVKRIIR